MKTLKSNFLKLLVVTAIGVLGGLAVQPAAAQTISSATLESALRDGIIQTGVPFDMNGQRYLVESNASGGVNLQTLAIVPTADQLPALNPSLSGGLQQIWDATATSTNFAVAVGAGRGLKGDKNLAFADYCYNLNNNVGLILGYDAIRAGGTTTYSFVKGGLQLKADIYPLKNFGLTTFKVTPFAALLINSGSGNVGQIVVAGASHRFTLTKNWGLNLGGFYENRTGGKSITDGVYLCGMLALSRNF